MIEKEKVNRFKKISMDKDVYQDADVGDPSKYDGEPSLEPELEQFGGFTFLFGTTEVVGLLALILIAVWEGSFRNGFSWRSNPESEFNWHPLLMTLGMIFINANGIIMFRAFPDAKVRTMKLFHALIHLGGFIVTVIGIVAVYDYQTLSKPPKTIMYSLHSWIGAISITILMFQWIISVFLYFLPSVTQKIQIGYYPLHSFFGINSFAWSASTSLIGLTEKAILYISEYKTHGGEGVFVNIIGLTILLFSSLVVLLLHRMKLRPRYLLESSEMPDIKIDDMPNTPMAHNSRDVTNVPAVTSAVAPAVTPAVTPAMNPMIVPSASPLLSRMDSQK